MCGICGIVTTENRLIDHTPVTDMLATIRHRGPDDYGVYLGPHCGLGHARLSIIDLSGGHQPMQSLDPGLWITFNGEIFNYIELREELIRKGRRFLTSSDTEVILQLYAEEGEECVKRLNGQWAFAIWDTHTKKLFLSRDRCGVRPLFYAQAGRNFLFASEIKSILAHPSMERRLDLEALSQTFTFWHTVPPHSSIKGISELPPGCSMTVVNGETRITRYWQMDFPTAGEGTASSLSEAESIERLEELLIDATRVRLRADVPVGAYLSGGLDSSLISAIVRRFTNSPLSTFSISFEEEEFDESAYQRQMAAHLETEHHEIRCSHQDIVRVFPDVVWHAEKPLLRTSPAPMYMLSKLVRDSGFKVVLTGEGADEMFGGYDLFKETKIRSSWSAHPESRLRPMLLRRLYPYMGSLQSQPEEYLRMFFRVRPEDCWSPFFSHLPRWEMTAKLKLFFSREVKSEMALYSPRGDIEAQLPKSYDLWDSFKRAQYLESAYLLPGYILSSQGDRVSMAHAIEGRFPFLDHRVVEFACSLPLSLKMRGLNEKVAVKRFASKLLPPDVVKRHKQPYRSPDVNSFVDSRRGRFRADYVSDLLSSSCVRRFGIFDPDAVSKLASKVRSQQTSSTRDGMALVGILSTQLFYQQFIENFKVRTHHDRGSAEVTRIYQ